MITIALHHMGGEQWTAGLIVQEMLLQALHSLPAPRPCVKLTVWKETPERDIEAFRSLVDEVICLPAAGGKERAEVLGRHGVDVFFSLPTESALDLNIPRIVWMYDFQHRHYPENFSTAEVNRRDRLFKAHAASADRILIYSQAVMTDLAAVAPESIGRARLVRFVPHIPPNCCEMAPGEICLRYGLPERFFFLPNHFLPHKNHAIVIEALGHLAACGRKPAVVCTGQDKTLVAETLAARCGKLSIEKQFIRLGLVPRGDYFQLLRKSVALINPSLFEGFGLSVAEAAGLGKKVLLSDIPVLREHDAPRAEYFAPDDSLELASKMAALWDDASTGFCRDPAAERQALARLSVRRDLFGMNVMRIAQEAVENRAGAGNACLLEAVGA
ncbi:MAG: glycosyltransferase family 1 protein [bacterium]